MERQQRRLAAILAADVAGYSRLMGTDEAGTLARFNALRSELLDPKIAQFKGRVVGSAGDSLLVEFGSAVDAVQCAVEAQERLAARDTDLPEARRMAFRMGINLGDVIAEGATIHGDGVNVASRLEKLAEPGVVVVARSVYDQVKGKLPYAFTDLGEHQVKNISEPVRVYRVETAQRDAIEVGGRNTEIPAMPDKPSIAVLAFNNMSGDPEQDYYCDGITEDIITELSRFRSLFVIARNSSFAYKGRAIDVRQIGRELGVRYVLEGSVRRMAQRLRFSAQLIEAETGNHVWAERYDGNVDEIFDLQDRITEAVVGVLEPTIRRAEIERVRRKRPGSPSAHDHYLRALAETTTHTRESIQTMLDHSLKAIALDPQFATAYAMAARAYMQKWGNGWCEDEAKERAEFRDILERGLRADRSDPLMLAMAGHCLAQFWGEISEGIAYLDEAISLNPNQADTLMRSGFVRTQAGQLELAREHLDRARRLSPNDSRIYAVYCGLADVYLMEGNFEEARQWAERATQNNPNYIDGWLAKASVAAHMGRDAEARQAMARVLTIDPKCSVRRLLSYIHTAAPENYAAFFDGLRRAGLPD